MHFVSIFLCLFVANVYLQLFTILSISFEFSNSLFCFYFYSYELLCAKQCFMENNFKPMDQPDSCKCSCKITFSFYKIFSLKFGKYKRKR